MFSFVRHLAQRVLGVLSGFDRVLFRGTLRCVIDARGLNGYLYGAKVAMTDFDKHAERVTKQLIEASLAPAKQANREILYLDSSEHDKKEIAREIAQRDGIQQGLICVLRCLEPCMSFYVKRDRETQKISLVRRKRKCVHLYHYFQHPRFGLMHVRLQTWFPFMMQICLNGREWLARDLARAGIEHRQRDNCICQVDDFQTAQHFLDQQLKVSWPTLLDDLRQQVHPAHETIFAHCPEHARHYYWTVAESEWASDVLFADPSEVLPIAERLAAYTLRVHGPADVMRFLGRKACANGLPRLSFQGEIHSDARVFDQGLRIKHRIDGNSVKMYNRPGVLRFETTINNPEDFKVYRRLESDTTDTPPDWHRLRRGVADIHRRAEVSQLSNNRFAEAQLAVLANDSVPLKEQAAALCSRVKRPGREKPDGTRTKPRMFRALNPLAPDDVRLLTVISQPKFGIAGLRNGDMRAELFGADPTDGKELRRRSSAVSRKLALLRAHGLLEKVSKGNQYRVTEKGRHSLTALLAAANATTTQLTTLAA